MKLLIERLQKFSQLSSGERVLLIQAWTFFLVAEIALWTLPVRRILRLIPVKHLQVSRRDPLPPASAPSIARTAWLVDVAGRYAPVRDTCLKKALVLSWLLGRRGTPTTVRIGVVRRAGRITAHAWLERDGQPIAGLDGGEGYEPLFATRGLLDRNRI